MYLIKAEALNELGQTAAAIAQVNLVRARAFTPPKPLSATLSRRDAARRSTTSGCSSSRARASAGRT